MTSIKLSTRWAVNAETSVVLDANTTEVWQVMELFSQFIAADPYHTNVTDAQGNCLHAIPPRGTALRIGHGIGFTWFNRVGTLIRVVPQHSLAFTDLSPRGRAVGFPHVYRYQLTPINDRDCVLKLVVRGKWSARWLPRPLIKLWLWWVMTQANWSLRLHTAHEVAGLRKQANACKNASQRKVVHS